MDTTTTLQLNISQLRKAIQQALKLPDGTVIGGWQPENGLPYFVTVDLIAQTEIGQSKRTFDGQTEQIDTSLISQISINSNNAFSLLTKLKSLFQSSRLIDALKAMNAGIVRFSDVRNLTAVVVADYEERAQFDCFLSHTHRIKTPLEPIEQVKVSVDAIVEIKR